MAHVSLGLRAAKRGEAAGGEAGGVDEDADGAPGAADEGGFGDVGDLFHRVVELGGEAAEREMVVVGAVEGEGEDGDVVDAFGFDERLADSGRDAVEVGAEFFGDFDEALLGVLADFEADDHE